MKNSRRWICGSLIGALMTFPMGCETMQQHKTASGAGIGAVVGAAGGALLDKHHRGRGALIGAAAGAAIGGGIGYYLDQKAKKLRAIEDVEVEELEEATTSQGTYVPPRLNVIVNDQTLFEQGSSALSNEGCRKLEEIAQVINEDFDSIVIVKGYTSSEGSDESNRNLSKNRADVVRDQLIASGVEPSRIRALGMGESKPIGNNNTEAGRAQNRRVEIEMRPTGNAQ